MPGVGHVQPGSTWHAGAAVTVDGVAVVALLVALDFPVAADLHDGVDAGLAGRGAGVAGLNLADARAAVAGRGVAVVARLARLDHPVAAHGRGRVGTALAVALNVGGRVVVPAVEVNPGRARAVIAALTTHPAGGVGAGRGHHRITARLCRWRPPVS